jgi:ParB/RepB/Spo0J family partition protein
MEMDMVIKVGSDRRASLLGELQGKSELNPGRWSLLSWKLPYDSEEGRYAWFISKTPEGQGSWVVVGCAVVTREVPREGSDPAHIEWHEDSWIIPPSRRPVVDDEDVDQVDSVWADAHKKEWFEVLLDVIEEQSKAAGTTKTPRTRGAKHYVARVSKKLGAELVETLAGPPAGFTTAKAPPEDVKKSDVVWYVVGDQVVGRVVVNTLGLDGVFWRQGGAEVLDLPAPETPRSGWRELYEEEIGALERARAGDVAPVEDVEPEGHPVVVLDTPALGGLVELALVTLDDSPRNPRQTYDDDALSELATSIQSYGVLEPIIVRPGEKAGRYEIVAGHRRVRGARRAMLKTIPALVRELTDAEALEIAVIENNQREDPDPLEEAAGLAALVQEHGRELDDLAARLGRPVRYVRERVQLAGLGDGARELVAAGRIGLGSALAVARLPAELQRALCSPGGQLDPASTSGWQGSGQPKSWSRDQVDEAITRETRDLSRAPWELDEQLGCRRACVGCPMRSSAQASLLPGAEQGDRCLDPACWSDKVAELEANAAKALADERGVEVWGVVEQMRLEDSKEYESNTIVRADSSALYSNGGMTWEEVAPETARYARARVWGYANSLDVDVYMFKAQALAEVKARDEALWSKITGRATKASRAAAKEAKKARREQRQRALEVWEVAPAGALGVVELALREWLTRDHQTRDVALELVPEGAVTGDSKYARVQSLGRWVSGLPADELGAFAERVFAHVLEPEEVLARLERAGVTSDQADGADALEGAAE